MEQKQRYAAWKAADIRKALAEGRQPTAGPPGGATAAAPGAVASGSGAPGMGGDTTGNSAGPGTGTGASQEGYYQQGGVGGGFPPSGPASMPSGSAFAPPPTSSPRPGSGMGYYGGVSAGASAVAPPPAGPGQYPGAAGGYGAGAQVRQGWSAGVGPSCVGWWALIKSPLNDALLIFT